MTSRCAGPDPGTVRERSFPTPAAVRVGADGVPGEIDLFDVPVDLGCHTAGGHGRDGGTVEVIAGHPLVDIDRRRARRCRARPRRRGRSPTTSSPAAVRSGGKPGSSPSTVAHEGKPQLAGTWRGS